MAEVIGTASNATASFVTKEMPVANGVTVSDGDTVYLASGRVTNATIAGATILGIVQGSNANDPSNVSSVTAGTTGNSAGTATVLVIVDPSVKVIYPVSGGTLSATNLGGRYNLTGTTGAQTAAIGAGGTQVECIGTNIKGDYTRGLFIINKHEYKVSA